VAFLLAGLQPPTNVARRVRELQEILYQRWGLLSPLALPPLIPLAFFDPGAAGAGGRGAARPSEAGASEACAGEVPAGSRERAPDSYPPGPASRVASRLAEDLRRVLRGPSAPRAPRLRTAGLAVAGGPSSGQPAGTAALFWQLEAEPERGAPPGALTALADLVRARVEAGPRWPSLLPPPFPVHPGFFLALQEQELNVQEVAAALPPPEPLAFPAAALTVLRVRRLNLEPFPGDAAAATGPPTAAGPGSAAAVAQPSWWRALLWEELLNVPLKKPPREAAQETG
jgi:hypothetical protein